MKKEVLVEVVLIPIIIFSIIVAITMLHLLTGLILMIIWGVGFLVATVGVTVLVTHEQIRSLNEKDAKEHDKD